MTRDEIVQRVADVLGVNVDDEKALDEEGVILFDGMENAFIGVAERFEEGGHRFFAVYSYKGMVQILNEDGENTEDAIDYLEFNTVGLYAGPGTPAIMRDFEEHM
jgi:hypothetical protein